MSVDIVPAHASDTQTGRAIEDMLPGCRSGTARVQDMSKPVREGAVPMYREAGFRRTCLCRADLLSWPDADSTGAGD